MATELPPTEVISSPDTLEAYYAKASIGWVESLKQRHDTLGIFSALPYDPKAYPAQRLETVILPPTLPDRGAIAEHGRPYLETYQAKVINQISNGARFLMGPSYDFFVRDLLEQRSNPDIPHSMLRNIWGRTNTPNNSVAVIMEHTDLLSPPLIMAALTEAFSQTQFAKDEAHHFDFFKLVERNYLFINKSLAFLAVQEQPATDLARPICHQLLVVPPTRNTLRMGIPKQAAKLVTKNFEEQYGQAQARHKANNESPILYISPFASTSEKSINKATADLLTGTLALPVSLVMGKTPRWHIGQLQSITRPEILFEVMAQLDTITEELRAKDVASALGATSLKST
jgi:hypothetical protein